MEKIVGIRQIELTYSSPTYSIDRTNRIEMHFSIYGLMDITEVKAGAAYD